MALSVGDILVSCLKVMLTGQAAGLASPTGAGACWNGHLNVDKTLAHHL